jgi:hypothetical protein
VRVGRSPGSEILLTDPAVSREHAVLEWMPDSVGGGSWRITDRGSSAGTTVNGVTLRAYQSLPLEAGDRVGIGPLSLDYVRRAPEEHSTVIGRIEPAGGEHIEPIGAVALEAGHLDAVVAAGAESHAATDEHGIAVAATAAIAAASGFSDVAFVRVRDGAFEVVAAQGRAAGGVRLSRVVCVAVELGDRNYGFLYLADGGAFRAPLEPVAALVRAVASVAALAFANLERLRTTTRLEAEHRAMFDGTMQALIASIDAKDPYTRGHSARVAEFAHLIAVAAGMSPADADRARLCGLVHDIGKIGVPESVLRKAGKLDDEEFRQIAQHPVTGHEILRGIPQMADVLPGVLHHHEKWAGGGYPHGIAGDEIPVLGRLIAVADALDAMTTSRTYRSARPMAAAVEEIARCSGTHFDPGFAKVVAELDRRSLQAIVGLHVFAPGSLPGLVDAAAGAGLPATAGILRGHAEVARRTA